MHISNKLLYGEEDERGVPVLDRAPTPWPPIGALGFALFVLLIFIGSIEKLNHTGGGSFIATLLAVTSILLGCSGYWLVKLWLRFRRLKTDDQMASDMSLKYADFR